MQNFKDQQLQSNCPGCQNLITFSLNQAQNEEAIKCPACGQLINLNDENGSVKKSVADANSALGKLEEKLNNFKININL